MLKLPVLAKIIIGGIGYQLFKSYMKLSNRTPRVIDEDKTVQYIISNNVSVARFGDGEFLWGFQERQSGNFEKNSIELSKRLTEVIGSSNPNLIICIPNIFNNLKGRKIATRTYWEGFLMRKGPRILKLLDSSKTYFDTQFTRPYMDYYQKSRNFKMKFHNIKKIWYRRNILIVEGDKTRFGVGDDLLDDAKKIKRIICPSENAFEVYSKILNTVKDKGIYTNNVLVLISLGPAATILAFDLSSVGIQSIDIGHLDVEYQWYRMQAKKKVPIIGKYVNEASIKYSRDLPIDDLREYKKQIICCIN